MDRDKGKKGKKGKSGKKSGKKVRCSTLKPFDRSFVCLFVQKYVFIETINVWFRFENFLCIEKEG